ncbi:MAG: hypothetical protein SFV15_24615 [Polyangiaceae bacterium]|nr:hypothetical protein [Polyangiaceae bacterium]
MKACWLISLMLVGCAEGAFAGGTPSGSVGVTQAGAQDAAHFRSLVAEGKVPEPSVLDQVGFFAEHALDQPPAACGEVVCAHPMLAVAPRFDDGTWTMAFVSLNSSVDPNTRPRKPVHLVLAVEVSAATQAITAPSSSVVSDLLGSLLPEDRLSVVAYATSASSLLQAAAPGAAQLRNLTFPVRSSDDGVDLYGGIAAAADALAMATDFQGGSRIVLVTSGMASAGITDANRIEALASAIVSKGTPLSVLGVGDNFQAELPRRLADVGAGTYAYAQDPADLVRLVQQEGNVRLLPLAMNVELKITPSPGYTVGRVYGARRAFVEDGGAVLRTPALFLGTRSGAQDVEQGRRGGGGGFFVELLADSALGAQMAPGQPAFHLDTSYVDADTNLAVKLSTEVTNQLAPGQRPTENWPSFSHPEYGKAFMMLNMYLALRTMLDLYEVGDCGSALGASYMMDPGIEEWKRRFSDPDIDADAGTMVLLRQNISEICRATPVPPSNYEPGCFSL